MCLEIEYRYCVWEEMREREREREIKYSKDAVPIRQKAKSYNDNILQACIRLLTRHVSCRFIHSSFDVDR